MIFCSFMRSHEVSINAGVAPLQRCLGSIQPISVSVMAPARLSSFRGNDAIEANLRLAGLTNVSLSSISKDFILHSSFRVSLSSYWLSLTRFLEFIFCSSSSPLNHISPFLFLFLCLSLHPSGHLQDGVICDEDARGRVHARKEDR